MICERPQCSKPTSSDLLYCSDRCYDLDNDPTPITVCASRNQATTALGTFAQYDRTPVHLPPDTP